MSRPPLSFQMVATGTGLARRRLTLDEALDGLLPEPFQPHEWLLMHMKSRQLQARMTGVAAPKAVRRRVGELWAAYVTAHESDWRPKTFRRGAGNE